jgi:hypothetical protein
VVLARKLSAMERTLSDDSLSRLRLPDLDYEIDLDTLLTGANDRRTVDELVRHLRAQPLAVSADGRRLAS